MADFLLLSTADWDHPLWTNKQHVALALAQAGHRVLYVDSLGLRPPRSGKADRQRILKRLWHGLRPIRQVHHQLWVISPLVLPGGTHGLALRLNRWLLRFWLGMARLQLGFRRPVLWTYNPLTLCLLPGQHWRGLIYHCVDRIQAQPGMPADLIQSCEQELCRRADVVFTTAPQLQRELLPLNPRTFFYPNVADFNHFAAALSSKLAPSPDLAVLPRPRIGFVGAIDGYKLDLPMLAALAHQTPAWTYVMVGPVAHGDPATDVSCLKTLANVHFLGPRTYAELPSLLAGLDVALLPLQQNTYTRHMFPMKFFEYLAAGRPVVATAIPSLKPFASVAILCPNESGAFHRAIARTLAGDCPDLPERLAVARRHTYQARTTHMLADLEAAGLLMRDLPLNSVSP